MLAGVPLDEKNPHICCDAESYVAAAVELTIQASRDGQPESVRDCVVNPTERRYGQGSSAQFDFEGFIEMTLGIDTPTPDNWDSGTFWSVAQGQRGGAKILKARPRLADPLYRAPGRRSRDTFVSNKRESDTTQWAHLVAHRWNSQHLRGTAGPGPNSGQEQRSTAR